MYRASAMGGSPVPAMFLVVALILGVAGCGGSGPTDLAPTFGESSVPDKSYDQNLAIDGETLPEASGGDGTLTYSLSPRLPAGLTFDAATRVLSGTPTAPQAAILYTYTATDGDAEEPDSASLTFRITVEAVATVTLSVASTEVDEGEDRRPLIVTANLSQPVRGALTVALASTGTAVLGSDFDLASAEVTVAAGSTRATTTVTPIRDLEAEYDETITLEIASVAGRGEIGPTPSVDIVIRDLGARHPQPPYAALEAFLLIHRLEEDAVSFVVHVTNIGDVAASSTRAVLYTTTDDLFSSSPDLTGLDVLRVPVLEQGGWWLSGPIWVPFNDLVRGKTNYFYFCARAAPGEDPALVGCGAVDYTAVFLTDGNRIPTTCTGSRRDTEPGTQDPLFGQQWSLNNTGQASFAADGGVAGQDLNMRQTLVDGPTGAHVQVAVVDTGLEICHPDLAANVELNLSYNFNAPIWHGAQADDPFLPTVMGDHGTSVAGLIAAAASNGVGGRGVAPAASLRGFNLLASSAQETILFDALGMSEANPRSDDVHVFNMSFGSIGSAENLPDDQRKLFRVGVTRLREGRGALYVKAAGNDFNDCTELDADRQPVAPLLDLSVELGCTAANRDGENNLPYVIVAGGFSADGKRSSYSSAGATLWVVVPAGEYGRRQPAMITTDQMGTDRGYGLYGGPLGSDREANPLGDYTSIFNGTSSAAPNTSGAVALLLETKPALTWRDVKHILAKTARRLDADIPRVRVAFGGTPAVLQHGWITNASGYHFHNWYGFGAIDVDAAVALAATHTPNSLGVFTESAPVQLAAKGTIPDHDGGGLTQTQNVTGLSRTANIEAVQLRLEVTHANPRELGVELISPAGTRSIINPVFNDALKGVLNPLDWTILSNAFYGESPSGEWTLNVIDAAEGNIGTLDAWSLIFYLGEHPEDG